LTSAHVTREQGSITDRIQVAHPANKSLQTKTEATMRASTVLALISVPVVGSGVQIVALVGSHQLIKVLHTHRSTDDLTDTRDEDIDRLSELLVVGVFFHVEGLHDLGEVCHHDGGTEVADEGTLRSISDVITVFELADGVFGGVEDAEFVALVDGLVVGEADEGLGGAVLPVGGVAGIGVLVLELFRVQFGDELTAVLDDVVIDVADEVLEAGEEVFEGDETVFGFDVSELSKMAVGLLVFSAVRGEDTEDITDGGEAGLEVELRRLSHVGLLAVVLDVEELGATFSLSLDDGRGLNFKDTL